MPTTALRLNRHQIGHFFFQISQWGLKLFLVCFPFQIRALLYNEPFYLTGNFNIYRSFFVSISDIILVFTLFSYGIYALLNKKIVQKGNSKLWTILILFFVSLLIAVFLAENKTLSFLLWLRWVECLGLYLLIINRVIPLKELIQWLLGSLALQAVMAITQFTKQSSLGLRFLGEPIIGQNILGAAKFEIGSVKLIRPYGTFPHPNILAGALLIGGTIYATLYKKISNQKEKIAYIFGGILLCIAFLLTFSRGAFVAAIITLTCYFFFIDRKRWQWIMGILGFIGVIIFITAIIWKENPLTTLLLNSHGQALPERFLYMDISLKMFWSHPFGVGLGDFTFAMQNFTAEKLSPWLFQPVHNIFLFILNEGGILAATLFMALFITQLQKNLKILAYFKHFSGKESNTIKKQAALFFALTVGIITLGLFDHYLASLPEGQILLFIFLGVQGIFLNEISKKMTVSF